MYEERKIKFNWKGFLFKLAIILLLLVLVIKFVPFGNKKESNGHTKVFNDNLTKIKDVGNNYFNKNTLPKSNEEYKVSLKQLIKDGKITTLKGSDRKTCNEDASYIKAYKKNVGYDLEIYLECGEESETSHIYLGCFDDCNIKPTTATTNTTTKRSTSSNNTKTTKKVTTTKTTTSTTTRVKTYAVIFNTNGGTKVNTELIVTGNKAIKPTNPTREGYIFKGWYINDKEFDFNSAITSNIILSAKWEIDNERLANLPTSKATKTYNQTLYSAVTSNNPSSVISTNLTLNVPEEIKEYDDIKIKSLTYIRNFETKSDIQMYVINKNINYQNDKGIVNNTYTMSNFGVVDNIELKKTTESDTSIIWDGLIKNNCNNPVNNVCSFGIVYRIIWEYKK